jgi:hypothetical protein
MLSPKPSTAAATTFPWQEGHACREDRAMGFELELIELVNRRKIAESAGDPVDVLGALDAQIEATMIDLATEAAEGTDPLVA